MPARTIFGSAGFEGGDDLVEVGAGVFDAQAAETVVAAELDDDDGGLQGEDGVEAFDTVLGGVAADALVDDAVVVARRRGRPGGSRGSFCRIRCRSRR